MTSNGTCRHSNGNPFSQCYKGSVYSLSDCEADCTASNFCVGYFHGKGFCVLLPSSQSYTTCPNGYTFSGVYDFLKMAETSDDLVAFSYSGYQCYAKNEGINNLYLSN